MTEEHFKIHKNSFFNLTGKNADDNLEAFFGYITVLSNMDINDKLKLIYEKLNSTS